VGVLGILPKGKEKRVKGMAAHVDMKSDSLVSFEAFVACWTGWGANRPFPGRKGRKGEAEKKLKGARKPKVEAKKSRSDRSPTTIRLLHRKPQKGKRNHRQMGDAS